MHKRQVKKGLRVGPGDHVEAARDRAVRDEPCINVGRKGARVVPENIARKLIQNEDERERA
jgi:hypothetical protein